MGKGTKKGKARFHDTTPVDQDDVLLVDYAYAEMLEPGRWNPDAAKLAVRVEEVGGPANLPLEEKRSLIDRISRHREPMLGFLLRNRTNWFAGSFDVEAVGALRLTRWFLQPQFANARTIDELLESLGGATYAKLDFQLSAMRGRPIIVAADLGGPYCLIEGTSRCCEIVRLARRNEVPSATIPFVLGVCRNIAEYTPYLGGVAISGVQPWWVPGLPEISIKALLDIAERSKEGQLVAAVAIPWFEILDLIRADPRAAYEIDARKWEEIVAGAYKRAGFDEVLLTPRSADKGRDVVATKSGIGSIRIFDQVKAYKPGHVVTADEVRAMLGVITGAQNVSKAVITTTSTFAPHIGKDDYLAPFIPYRLELKPREILLPWLDDLAKANFGKSQR